MLITGDNAGRGYFTEALVCFPSLDKGKQCGVFNYTLWETNLLFDVNQSGCVTLNAAGDAAPLSLIFLC